MARKKDAIGARNWAAVGHVIAPGERAIAYVATGIDFGRL
jgi:hypothetical protein